MSKKCSQSKNISLALPAVISLRAEMLDTLSVESFVTLYTSTPGFRSVNTYSCSLIWCSQVSDRFVEKTIMDWVKRLRPTQMAVART